MRATRFGRFASDGEDLIGNAGFVEHLLHILDGEHFVPRRVARVEAKQRLEVLQRFRLDGCRVLTRLGARMGRRTSRDNHRGEQASSHAGQNT